MTISLNAQTITLAPADERLLGESLDARLVDEGDGLGVDLQGYVARLGGWTTIATFKPVAA